MPRDFGKLFNKKKKRPKLKILAACRSGATTLWFSGFTFQPGATHVRNMFTG